MSTINLKYYDGNGIKFPRELTKLEKDLLFSVLPENKPGYKLYREKINKLLVTGYGRYGRGNLILGEINSVPDNSFPSAPVFASGTIVFEECNADINIHEEIDNEIEIDIEFSTGTAPEMLHKKNSIDYSEWNPGQKAPGDNSEIREIVIEQDRYILAIAPVHKRIWLHENRSGVNYLIPVSNFYNYIMLIKNIRDAATVSNPSLFFRDHHIFSDFEIVSAFIIYNKYFKKFKIEISFTKVTDSKPVKKNLFNFFKKGRKID